MHAQANQYIDLTQKTNPISTQIGGLFGTSTTGQPVVFNIGTLTGGETFQYNSTTNSFVAAPLVNPAFAYFLSTS